MNSELVHVYTEDGIRLDGLLQRPEATARAWLPVDVVVCFHGVGGNFYSPYVFEPMAERLLAAGCAVIRTNNRGHDLMYNPVAAPNLSYEQVTASREANVRLGAAFEVVADCRKDFKAWIDLAAARGYTRMDARVACAIVSSPPRFSHEMNLRVATADEFKRNIDQAQRLIADGTPNALMTVTVPNANVFTARTFIDKYGPDDNYDILRHLPSIEQSTLITLGGDERSTAFTDLMAHGDRLHSQNSALKYVLIQGADHFYRDRLDELWGVTNAFLHELGATVSAG
jgi:pimeloyl-ACP methyl ester carboxylesterase